MICSPGMLVEAARKSGMEVPPDPDKYAECADDYPHFFCFCALQLNRSVVYWGEHWDNAKVIVGVDKSDAMNMTLKDYIGIGLSYPTYK